MLKVTQVERRKFLDFINFTNCIFLTDKYLHWLQRWGNVVSNFGLTLYTQYIQPFPSLYTYRVASYRVASYVPTLQKRHGE